MKPLMRKRPKYISCLLMVAKEWRVAYARHRKFSLTLYQVNSYISFSSKYRKRSRETRSRLLRNERMHAAWNEQMQSLVSAYMLWKHGEPEASSSTADEAAHQFPVAVVTYKGTFCPCHVCIADSFFRIYTM